MEHSLLTDADVDALLATPGCPVVGPMEAGDWLLPVAELLAFGEAHGLNRAELLRAVDAYAEAHGGLRVLVRPAFHRFTNAARRISGRHPVEPGEVWMFQHGHITARRVTAAEGPEHSAGR